MLLLLPLLVIGDDDNDAEKYKTKKKRKPSGSQRRTLCPLQRVAQQPRKVILVALLLLSFIAAFIWVAQCEWIRSQQQRQQGTPSQRMLIDPFHR